MLTKTIKKIVEKEIGTPLTNVQEINAGLNNRLFKVVTSEEKYLAKLYRKDANIMLKREFDALKYLKSQDIKNVPTAYFKDDKHNFAVYSFEEGKVKNPSQATRKDLNEMAYFIACIHKLQPKEIRKKFLAANFACFSINDYLKNIYFRLDKFSVYAKSKNIPTIINKLKKEGITTRVEDLVQNVLAGITDDTLTKKLSIGNERLSPVDFGVHNILFKKDGSLCFIDFEYFGRDDPVRAVADFLMHDRSLDIKLELKKYFQSRYLEYIGADRKYRKRLELVKKIIDIEWLAIYLYSMTPDKIKIRKFSDTNFDRDKYLDKQSLKLYSRLMQIENHQG